MFGMVNRTFAIHFRYLQKWESSRLSSSRTHVRLGAWFWSAKADIFFSESLHSTLRFGRRKTIVSQTMCALAERLSQSEIVLPQRKTCYYSPLAEVGVFSTEINTTWLYKIYFNKKQCKKTAVYWVFLSVQLSYFCSSYSFYVSL